MSIDENSFIYKSENIVQVRLECHGHIILDMPEHQEMKRLLGSSCNSFHLIRNRNRSSLL